LKLSKLSLRRFGWLALVLVVALAVIAVYRARHPDERGAGASVKRKPPERTLQASSAKLAPLPKNIRRPTLPDWLSDGRTNDAAARQAAEMVSEVELKGGAKAVLFTSKASYAASAPVDAHLELTRSDGTPWSGRADLEAMVVDPTSPAVAPFKTAFTERPDEPGRYDAVVRASSAFRRVAILLHVSESGNPNSPGTTELVETSVDHSAAATLGSVLRARLLPDGASMEVAVQAERAGHAALRAELRDGEGRSFGIASGAEHVAPGASSIRLSFPALRRQDPSAAHAFYLYKLTLFVDEKLADFRDEPVPVQFSE
jgi:hypothetical protein